MSTGSAGGKPSRRSQPPDAGDEEYLRSGRQAWRSMHDHMEADLARTVALLETIARVERAVADTLQAMAQDEQGEVAARRLRLAEEAIRGAHTAIERSEHLQEQAHRWQEHVEVARLRHALDRAGGLLTDLAHAEKDIADILTSLASEDGSELAAQRRRLAKQALAGARRADERARALRQLTVANAAWIRAQ